MNDPVPTQGESEGTPMRAPLQLFPVAMPSDAHSESQAAAKLLTQQALPITDEAAARPPQALLEASTPPRRITIAFDGGCIGNPGPGGYGAILVNDRTGSEMIVKGREADTTNNRMELWAAIEGLSALRPGAFVHMLGDSQYVINGFTKWLLGWKLKGWKTAGGTPVLNVDLWRALDMAVERHERVTWEWVKGHSGHELNERVDRIANGEAKRAELRLARL